MLDRKFIVENADDVKQNCTHRGVPADVDRLVELELLRRDKQKEVEELNRQANEVSKSIGQAKDPEMREARKEEGRRLREQKDQVQAEVDRLDQEVAQLQAGIPNMSHPDAPVGADDTVESGTAAAASTNRAQFDFPVLRSRRTGRTASI